MSKKYVSNLIKKILIFSASIAYPPFHLKNWRMIRLLIFVAADLICFSIAYYGAFVMRLEDWFLGRYLPIFLATLPIILVAHLSIFHWGGVYRQVWRFANANSAILILRCMLYGTILSSFAIYMLYEPAVPPRSVPVMYFLLGSLLIGLQKFSWRAWNEFRKSFDIKTKEPCIVYGAGVAGELFSRHMRANIKFPYHIACFIDDDRNKRGRTIDGIRIEGERKDLGNLCAKYRTKTIILAMPSASGKTVREIVNACKIVDANPLIMPELSSTLDDHIIQPRKLDIRDLLRRAPASIDKDFINKFFRGKTVLITGAGGSIGSELCRQICESSPSHLVLVDSCEFNLFKIDAELEKRFPNINRHPKLCNVTDENQIHQVFSIYCPNVVMHAAAYKHVPMVEKNATAGALNNILGTKVVAEAANQFGAKNFILISTDKAVNPTSVMGASKRCCELLVQEMHRNGEKNCKFSSVRFGNVLGRSGSVVPQFLEQIQSGGPVTVTHPEVTRYFMLTSEAVGLVLQAGSRSEGGEIFVLNMGEPVRIYDMATQLIELAGKTPGKDIEIVVTGLRPGEKLYEELILKGTEQSFLHEDIFILTPQANSPELHIENILKIIDAAQKGNEALCLKLLRSTILPDARPTPKLSANLEERVH